DFLRELLNVPPHCPVNLWAIDDPEDGTRPDRPMAIMIMTAIYGSKTKMLTTGGICNALIERFHWFKEHRQEKGWKHTVNHNLTQYHAFVHVDRSRDDPGIGSYWTID
ncbi:hypothetical protein C8R43DRAFT_822231, partial [Mycena crocata]